jgi:hypothetical protein
MTTQRWGALRIGSVGRHRPIPLSSGVSGLGSMA